MSLRNKLIRISGKTGLKFARVEDGQAFHIDTLKTIQVDHIGYQTMPKDGFYLLNEHTCGGGKDEKHDGVIKYLRERHFDVKLIKERY